MPCVGAQRALPPRSAGQLLEASLDRAWNTALLDRDPDRGGIAQRAIAYVQPRHTIRHVGTCESASLVPVEHLYTPLASRRRVPTNTKSSWLARLEHDTRDLHARAEADRFCVLDNATLAGYRWWLATVYHYEYAVEARLVYADLPLRFLADNLRSGLLGDDLHALGIDRAAMRVFAQHIERPAFRDDADALGALYVLQRNSLFDAALYRALAPRLRHVLQIASRYLTAHANSVYERWHQLGAHLDAATTTPERAAAIVEAARDAFERQHAWFVQARKPGTVEVVSARSA